MNKHRRNILINSQNKSLEFRAKRDLLLNYDSRIEAINDYLLMAHQHLKNELNNRNHLGLLTDILNTKYEINKERK